MIEETYLKQTDDNTYIVSFEGDLGSINKLRNYVEYMYDEPIMCEDGDASEDVCDMVNRPTHYTAGKLETIRKIDVVLDGLAGKEAYYLGNVLKYFDRAGLKDDAMQDLEKASNYAYRLVTGEWKYEN